MAIKNTKLGGTDWSGEAFNYEDINDTFDAVADGVQRWELLDSGTLSGSGEIELTGSLSDSYAQFFISITGISSSSNSGSAGIRINSDSGSNYNFSQIGGDIPSNTAGGLTGASYVFCSQPNTAHSDQMCKIWVSSETGNTVHISGFNFGRNADSDYQHYTINGGWTGTAAITSIEFYPASSQTLDGGDYVVYGLRRSI